MRKGNLPGAYVLVEHAREESDMLVRLGARKEFRVSALWGGVTDEARAIVKEAALESDDRVESVEGICLG